MDVAANGKVATATGTTEIGTFLESQVGRVYHSSWRTIDQAMVDAFASVTGDRVDPTRAAPTPFGGTAAQGFLLLSLLAVMRKDTDRGPTPGVRIGVNYGFDRVRFVSSVSIGSRVRGRFITRSVIEKRPGTYQEEIEAAIECEGCAEPVLEARWIIQAMT
jgi:acyl dehydratase